MISACRKAVKQLRPNSTPICDPNTVKSCTININYSRAILAFLYRNLRDLRTVHRTRIDVARFISAYSVKSLETNLRSDTRQQYTMLLNSSRHYLNSSSSMTNSAIHG